MKKFRLRDRVVATLGLVLVVALTTNAHVGSPDVYCEGDAGPYHLYVTVRVPQVIPGVAEVQIRSADSDVRAIQIVPMRLSGPGSNLPPVPDLAQQSKQDPQFFTGSLWLMEFGALKVRITADGVKGKGELSVPVPAVAQRTLGMNRPLGALLAFLMAFLAVGLVFIAGAAVREGNLAPGETPSSGRARRARIVMAITAVVVGGILFLGRAWWGAEANTYQRDVNMFKPPLAVTKLENGNRLVIRPKGQDPVWSQYVKMEQVIPDHNHLMHLFLISVQEWSECGICTPRRSRAERLLRICLRCQRGDTRSSLTLWIRTVFPGRWSEPWTCRRLMGRRSPVTTQNGPAPELPR